MKNLLDINDPLFEGHKSESSKKGSFIFFIEYDLDKGEFVANVDFAGDAERPYAAPDELEYWSVPEDMEGKYSELYDKIESMVKEFNEKSADPEGNK